MAMLELVKKLKFQSVFGVCIYLSCFAFLWWLSWMAFKHSDTPKDISEIKMAIISIVSIIVGYFFGSSSSSKSKEELLKAEKNTGANNNQ